MTTASHGAAASAHGRLQLARRYAPAPCVAPGDLGQLDVGADQGDGGPPARRRPRDGVTLAAGRAVAQEAHRIERLAGAAGGDDDAPAREVVPPPGPAAGQR